MSVVGKKASFGLVHSVVRSRGIRFPWSGGGSDENKFNSCARKYRHETELDAIEEAGRLTSKIGRRFEEYSCVWCDGWHVGSHN